MSNRSGDDRRQGPRREAERLLHYAEQNLMGAALAVADETDLLEMDAVLERLGYAADTYRAAREAVAPQSPRRQSPPKTKSETAAHYGEMLSGESESGR